MENRPYYHKLYADLIRDKYPDREADCRIYLQKENWTALDVIRVNELLFRQPKHGTDKRTDQMHRAYDRQSIQQILLYQQANRMNNKEIACMYSISRNTIAKWKKLFPKFAGKDKD
jgi:hypothetical protein